MDLQTLQEKFEIEKNAKNNAYAFILANGLEEEFKKFKEKYAFIKDKHNLVLFFAYNDENIALQKEYKELNEKLNTIRGKAVELATYIFGFCPLLPSGDIDLDKLKSLANNKLDENKKGAEKIRSVGIS